MKGLLLILLVVSASAVASEYPDSGRWLYTIGGFVLEDEIIGDREGQIVATGSSSMRFWGALGAFCDTSAASPSQR